VSPQGPVRLRMGPSGASSRFLVEYPLERYELYAHRQSSTIEQYDYQQNIDSDSIDVVKVVLNLDRSIAKNEPQWYELEKADIMDDKTFPLAMKSCISH
jgi:hypothetical protein